MPKWPVENTGTTYTTCFISLQACKIILHLPETAQGEKGYNALCRAVVVLLGCGVDYSRQVENLQGRVLVREGKGKGWRRESEVRWEGGGRKEGREGGREEGGEEGGGRKREGEGGREG